MLNHQFVDSGCDTYTHVRKQNLVAGEHRVTDRNVKPSVGWSKDYINEKSSISKNSEQEALWSRISNDEH